MKTTKAVILAAGLGTRMRRADTGVRLTEAQQATADDGLKAMIPIDRPFLDYVLSELADVGFRDVCLVVGPSHAPIRDYYTRLAPRRMRIAFAVQPRPLGTADALAAAAEFAGHDSFIAINSDNYYPGSALAELHNGSTPATIGFDRDALVARGNISSDRVAGFAIMRRDADGCLEQIQEKPDSAAIAQRAGPVLVSMNCWRFNALIFDACRRIGPSSRGEYEIPDAVMCAIREFGICWRVIPCAAGVLDLSRQQDMESVARALRGKEVNL